MPSGEILCRKEIEQYLRLPDIARRLVVTPLLEQRAIGESAVDLRLGNQFLTLRREAFGRLDLRDGPITDEIRHRILHRTVRNYREPFVLHPRQLVIGSTLEYVQLPTDLVGYVVGKSTWGRTGLIIATATKVDPGFRGCITLEILNEGEVPLYLYPGLRIAQLVLHRGSGSSSYGGRYRYPIGPEFPKFDDMDELEFWVHPKLGA